MASLFLTYIKEYMYQKNYISFHNKKHPDKLDNDDIEQFLSYLNNQSPHLKNNN